jgi:hypothetical protein
MTLAAAGLLSALLLCAMLLPMLSRPKLLPAAAFLMYVVVMWPSGL